MFDQQPLTLFFCPSQYVKMSLHSKLCNPQGAFLVRCRVHATNGEKLGYALSLKTELDVKHMKIDSTKAGGNFFYLSDTRKFRSFLRLI